MKGIDKMENIKYVITEEMTNLINAFEKVGYEVEVDSSKQFCNNGSFYYNRYCTTITIDQPDGEGEYYCFYLPLMES